MADTHTKILVRNASDSQREQWVQLPFSEEGWNEALHDIGIQEEEKEEVDDFESVISGNFPVGLNYEIVATESDYLEDEDFHDIESANELVDTIESFDDYEIAILDALLQDGCVLKEAIDAVQDGSADFYPDVNLSDLAQNFADEGILSQEFLLEHVDWEGVGRDLEFDGYHEVPGGVLQYRQ